MRLFGRQLSNPRVAIGKVILFVICLVSLPPTGIAGEWLYNGQCVIQKSYCLTEVEAKLLTKGIEKRELELKLLNLEIEQLKNVEHTTYYVEATAVGFVVGLAMGLAFLFGGR